MCKLKQEECVERVIKDPTTERCGENSYVELKNEVYRCKCYEKRN